MGMAKPLLLLVEPAPPAPFCNYVRLVPVFHRSGLNITYATSALSTRRPRCTRRRRRRINKRRRYRHLKLGPLKIRRRNHRRRRRRQCAITIKCHIAQHGRIPHRRNIPRNRQRAAHRLAQGANLKLDALDVGLVLRGQGGEEGGGGFGGEGGLDEGVDVARGNGGDGGGGGLDGDAEADLDAGGDVLGDDLLGGGVELVAVGAGGGGAVSCGCGGCVAMSLTSRTG